ncbi:MAG: hypothetical protein EBT03_12210, partial [Betaproteobacteria bacterium]|nr:hypothetical protein [Betaproteobacteria bacterium]
LFALTEKWLRKELRPLFSLRPLAPLFFLAGTLFGGFVRHRRVDGRLGRALRPLLLLGRIDHDLPGGHVRHTEDEAR